MALAYPQPLSDDAASLAPIDPGFSRDFDQTLGNAATDTDGFNVIFSAVSGSLKTADDCKRQLDLCLAKVGLAFNDLGTPFEQEFSDSLTTTIQSGDPDFKNYDVHLSGNNPPASGGGGSGGAGGSGGGGAVTRCDYTIYFGVDDVLPAKQSVTFKNLLSVPMHVHSKTFKQNVDGTFAETDNIPATMQPGATFDIDVTY